jgi:hypothetical protein
MLAARATPGKLAAIHELQITYKDPHDEAVRAPEPRRMFDVVAKAFARKGGVKSKNCVLPDGSSNASGVITCGSRGQGVDPYGVPYGGGRADVRLAVDGDGELYAMSKADGMIRKFAGAVASGSAPK